MSFADQKKQYRSSLLADQGELITINAGAGEVTRLALVNRQAPDPIRETPGVFRDRVQISLANDAALGVDADSIDKGTFYAKVAPNVGGTAQKVQIARVVSQDENWIVLEMQ